ncbi:hypothetical protein ILUMI_03788 [Ignelater luminosus]|uniref:Uncharacterized protein n=1 Tax=Ignelater luminosus TaxID=2038154 RepID=A0A8K0DFK4_IGNLU|nr:hypothetical protein ILUMI_03788 [Ignelater luminosus]
MMDLSGEMHDVLSTTKVLVKESEEFIGSRRTQVRNDFRIGINSDEFIDIQKINFYDDETWLYESPRKNSDVKDLKAWLYQDFINLKDIDFHTKRLSLIHDVAQIETKKSIDSRTFTRPKKRISRPSIEHYNEGYFKMDKTNASFDNNKYFDALNTTIKLNESIEENPESYNPYVSLSEKNEVPEVGTTQPLNFDYSQPTTNSCSSIGSDIPDSKRVIDCNTSNKIINKQNVTYDKEFSLNETYTAEEDTVYLDCTYQKESLSEVTSSTNVCLSSETITQPTIPYHQTAYISPDSTLVNNISPSVLNGTFKKGASAKFNDTFRKSPQYKSSELMNDDLNRTITIVDNVDSNRLNNTKRHSLILDNHKGDSNHVTNLKRNSIAYSAGSTDSLDYSSLSNSSKGSNKMLNMAEVDAIVLQQEQSLQVMSTPKRSSKIVSKLWENNCISPIIPTHQDNNLSDSEASSNDDFRTVGSSTSNMVTPFGSETHVTKTNKSLENFKQNVELPKVSPKSLNAIPTKTLSNKQYDNRFRGSYTNLKTVGTHLKGSYTNLKTAGANIKGSYTNLTSGVSNMKGSTSNLKTMSNNLKASYTKLKPVLTDLPNTNLKIFDPNATMTISKQSINVHANKNSEGTVKIAEVAPTLRDTAPKVQVKSESSVNCAIKPQLKASGLPRPVSAIPRPTGSRIPCPRNDRPASQRQFSRPDFTTFP